jgi:hypothetical protein
LQTIYCTNFEQRKRRHPSLMLDLRRICLLSD